MAKIIRQFLVGTVVSAGKCINCLSPTQRVNGELQHANGNFMCNRKAGDTCAEN